MAGQVLEQPTAIAPDERLPLVGRGVHRALAAYRHGRHDPTTRLSPSGSAGAFWRATLTPVGPGTIRIGWATPRTGEDVSLEVDAWGPGADWLSGRAGAMCGRLDTGVVALPDSAHPAVSAAARRHPDLRIGRSDALYHQLLPTILHQRITAGEAVRQWARLCHELGDPAPGPTVGLRLPPAPDDLRRRPAWWFHPLGVERRRAATLTEVARHAERLDEWSILPAAEAAPRLALLPGVGVWTIGSVLGPVMGDPDALCVGDDHAKHIVAWALHRRPRGTDDEMVASLEPYRGQRGRVLALLMADGHRAPAFGPRRRLLPVERW